MTAKTSSDTIRHVAKLANIPVSDEEIAALSSAFDETLDTVANLQEVSVEGIEPTHQVTGLTNVLRADEVLTSQEFTQEEALANAAEVHNGYFVVGRILENS